MATTSEVPAQPRPRLQVPTTLNVGSGKNWREDYLNLDIEPRWRPDILFDVNKSSLKSDARVALAKLSGILLVMSEFKIRIEGHTDSTGTPEYNLKLSKQRAESVKLFMTDEGIDNKRMSAIGFGIQKPIGDNATAEGRKQNRRVEIVLSAT